MEKRKSPVGLSVSLLMALLDQIDDSKRLTPSLKELYKIAVKNLYNLETQEFIRAMVVAGKTPDESKSYLEDNFDNDIEIPDEIERSK